MIEMFVTGVALDLRTNTPLVILNDKEQKYTLPIWIGHAEAQAIARALENIETDRPMTHDLAIDIIDALDADIESIEINAFENSTFFASLILIDSGENTLSVDARPSDAIAIALRNEAPIYISESILTDGLSVQDEDELPEDELSGKHKSDEEFHDFLESVKASDFTLKRDK